MSKDSTIGVGVIGIGFMGRTHIASYQSAQKADYPCRLVAVCDQDPQRRTGVVEQTGNIKAGAAEPRLFDPGQVRGYETPDELLADDAVDLVSICTHTETHADIAIAALRAGKHVLVEKPVALASVDVERVAKAAAESGTICMPAMCVRFWPGWDWAKQQIEDNTFGPVRSAVFNRLASRPDWADPFYADPKRTGGSLVDTHIHDADFIRYCFGNPDSVVSAGSLDHVTTLYRFAGGPLHVAAEGGWDHSPGFSFNMRYTIIFERATAEYDFQRPDRLRLSQDGQCESVQISDQSGYDGEIRHLIDVISGRADQLQATLDDAVVVARLLEAEGRSIKTGKPVTLLRSDYPIM